MASAAPAGRATEPGSARPARARRHLAPRVGDGLPARVDLDAPDPETHLVALARAVAPLRRALARLAGRLEALRAWERIGWARRRDYAVERLGVSGRQIQELARMDRAFADLPAVERAFASGHLTWTKVRLLARVASSEDAERWIAHAHSVTARELSREVRAVDARARDLLRPETDEDGESEGEAKQTVFVHCTAAVRAKWHRARFLASRLEGHPVPAWMVAERLAAEALSATPLDAAALERIEAEQAADPAAAIPEGLAPASPDSRAPGARSSQPSPNGCAPQGPGTELLSPDAGAVTAGTSPNGCAPQGFAGDGARGGSSGPRAATEGAIPDPLVAALLDRLDEIDAFELDARLRRALEAEQQRNARMGPWLLAVARGRLYRACGCASLGEFAREWLGISPGKAEALVRLERACEITPPLREAYRAGRLSWAKAQLLVPIAKREDGVPWHAAWVSHAEQVSVRRLGDEVARALAQGPLAPPPLEPPAGNWDAAAGEAAPDPQTGAHSTLFPKTMAFFFTAPRDVARLFRGALATVQRRIERRNGRTASESEALDAVLEHAFETWALTHAKLQRAHRVFDRDGWRCTFAGCTSYGNLQDHHIEYRSQGGSDELANRTTLCVWHHLRGEHAKILRCRGKAPGKLRFELGLRAGRPPLARYRSGDVRVC
jgi:hypothetical protein